MMEKLKRLVIKALQFLLNPRFLLCFGLGWIITNGWSYIMLGFGIFLENEKQEAKERLERRIEKSRKNYR